jgi:Carboxypeptidase regulatory-like domain/TonB dependent receptor
MHHRPKEIVMNSFSLAGETLATVIRNSKSLPARRRSITIPFQFLILLLTIAALALPNAKAQTSQGQINGQITDSSGGVIAGVTVTIENLGTQAQRVLQTNQAGDYVAPGLDAGVYSVTVKAQGFKSAVRNQIQIEVGLAIRADFKLDPGEVNQTIVVNTEAPLTDTTDSTLNGVLSNKAISELPVQGRDFQNLLMLHPGVQRTPGGGFQSITSNGNRPDDNNFYIDGADDMDVYYGESVLNDAGISGTPGSILPLDSIQEFNTQESPEADYGVKPGVVMNIGLKSGTNDIHGSAYYYHRNSALDARNFFNDSGQPVSSLLMHEFGGSIGGPIKTDKWFYFFNYEGLRDKVGNPFVADSPVTVSLVPFTAQLAQLNLLPADESIVDALAGCAPACSPLSQHLSSLFLPNPGFTQSQTDPAAINFDFNNTNRNDNIVAKTDYILNAHNTITGRFIYANTSEIEEDTAPIRPEWLSTAAPISQVLGADWTWTPNSQWVNQVRVSYNYFSEAILPLDHNANPNTTYGIDTGVTDPRLFGFPRIGLGQGFSCCYMGGNSGWPLETTPSRTINISDTASFTTGKHTLRFGGDYRYGTVNYFRATEGRGRVDFDSLEDFAAGNVEKWEKLYGDPQRNVNLKSVGFFIQDGYRIKPRLTINMGLRYDITAPIEDSNDLLANFFPTGPHPGIIQVGKGISKPYPATYNNISPRLGFAWDIFGTGKTVLRAGGGIIFEQPSIRTFMFSGGGLNLNPTAASLGVTPGTGNITNFLDISDDPTLVNWPSALNPNPGPIFPSGVGVGAGCSAPATTGTNPPVVVTSGNPCSIFGTTNLSMPYVANWNVNIQQAITPGTILQVAYVANRGIHLYGNIDENQPLPSVSVPCINQSGGFLHGDFSDCEQGARPFTLNCSASMNVGGIGTGGPCFPYLGQVDVLNNAASSTYHSLQVTLTKKYGHGLYLLAGYTYAHAIDTATNNIAPFPQNSLDFAGERGNSDFDIRNRFTLSATYELPSRDSKFQMLKGWEVTTIATLQGGEPYSLNDFGDDNSATGIFEDRWDISGSPKNIHWSTTAPIPFIDDFTTDGSGNVNGGNAQCIAAAQSAGGVNAVNMLANTGCYMENGTILTAPAFGTFGNSGRNTFRGPTFKNWDFSLSKLWKLNDRLGFQLRAEVFNLLNHPNFDVFTMNNDLFSNSTVGTVVATPDVASSNPVIGSGGSRHIQIGAKFTW